MEIALDVQPGWRAWFNDDVQLLVNYLAGTFELINGTLLRDASVRVVITHVHIWYDMEPPPQFRGLEGLKDYWEANWPRWPPASTATSTVSLPPRLTVRGALSRRTSEQEGPSTRHCPHRLRHARAPSCLGASRLPRTNLNYSSLDTAAVERQTALRGRPEARPQEGRG